MLGVVENLAAVLFQKGHRVGDHRDVFGRIDIQNLGDMEQPSFAHDCNDRRFGLEEHPHLRVGINGNSSPPRAAKRRDLRVFPFQLRGLAEKRRIARVGSRPPTLDVIHTKRIKSLGNANFVENRKRNSRALRAIAQRGVVDRDRFHEWAETLCAPSHLIKNAGTPRLT